MKKVYKRTLPYVITTVLLLSTGLVVYAASSGEHKQTKRNEYTTELQFEKVVFNITSPTEKMMFMSAVSKEAKEAVRLSDNENYDTNIANYAQLLEGLSVHEKYTKEIDSLLKDGHNISDILTAYSFLNDRFGLMEEVEKLVVEKEEGKSWTSIFKEYDKKNPEFEPRTFESGYIEEVMNTAGITADDIMLADRISQKSGKTIQEIMEKRMVGDTWKEINAGVNIINGDETILRVTVSPEQIDKYVNLGMDRETVMLGYVTATKLDQKAELIINELKKGTKIEGLLDMYYTQKYY